MQSEEVDQRKVDRFWGLDLYERNMHAEEKRLKEQYLLRVAQLNGYLAQTKAIRTFSVKSLSSDFSVKEPLKAQPSVSHLLNVAIHSTC